MIHKAVAPKGAKRDWVLDADLKSAFDKIGHNFLLERIGTFPAREQIRAWLKAGVVDKGRYRRPKRGNTSRRRRHAPNAKGNFCFEVTLGYRRVERGR